MADLLLVEVPYVDAVVLTATDNPLALGICSDEGRKQAKQLILVACKSATAVAQSQPELPSLQQLSAIAMQCEHRSFLPPTVTV